MQDRLKILKYLIIESMSYHDFEHGLRQHHLESFLPIAPNLYSNRVFRNAGPGFNPQAQLRNEGTVNSVIEKYGVAIDSVIDLVFSCPVALRLLAALYASDSLEKFSAGVKAVDLLYGNVANKLWEIGSGILNSPSDRDRCDAMRTFVENICRYETQHRFYRSWSKFAVYAGSIALQVLGLLVKVGYCIAPVYLFGTWVGRSDILVYANGHPLILAEVAAVILVSHKLVRVLPTNGVLSLPVIGRRKIDRVLLYSIAAAILAYILTPDGDRGRLRLPFYDYKEVFSINYVVFFIGFTAPQLWARYCTKNK